MALLGFSLNFIRTLGRAMGHEQSSPNCEQTLFALLHWATNSHPFLNVGENFDQLGHLKAHELLYILHISDLPDGQLTCLRSVTVT